MSTPVVTRADYQQLAGVRLAESKTLLDAGQWDGAYYLAGYAVEVALKPCIIKAVMARDAFLDKQFSVNCYTHNLGELVRLAGLEAARAAAVAADPVLLGNWGVVAAWSEQKRYHRMTEAEARALYGAVADAAHGVLPWVKTHW